MGPTDVGDDTNPKVIYNGITKNKLDNFKKLHNIEISEKDFYLLTNLLGGRGVDAASTINNLNAFDKDGIQQVKNLIDGYKEDLRKNGIDPEKLFDEEGDNENKINLTSILDKLAGKYQKGVSQTLGAKDDGRSGKQKRLKELAEDDKVSSSLRGEIKRDINEINNGKRQNIRVPQGYEMAHKRGYEARKGYGYEYSDLQIKDTHKLQHKIDGYGKKKEN